MSGNTIVEVLCFWIYNNKEYNDNTFIYHFPLAHYIGLFQAAYLARVCLPFKMDKRSILSYYFSNNNVTSV